MISLRIPWAPAALQVSRSVRVAFIVVVLPRASSAGHSVRKSIVKIAISGFALIRDFNTTQGQLQISKTCTIEKPAPNDTRRPQWPPQANGALHPRNRRHAKTRRSNARAVVKACGPNDLRTQQSSLRAARRYAGGGGAWSNRNAPPALVASPAPSMGGKKQRAPVQRRVSIIDPKSPFDQSL